MGSHKVMGDMSQVLGTFAMLSDYEQVILLSTTSTQSSMDLLGVKDDTLDFIELKKKGASLGAPSCFLHPGIPPASNVDLTTAPFRASPDSIVSR